MKQVIILFLCGLLVLGLCIGAAYLLDTPKPRKDLPNLDIAQTPASFSLDFTQDNSIVEANLQTHKNWDFERAYASYHAQYNMTREQVKEYMTNADEYNSFDVPSKMTNQSDIIVAGWEVRVSHTRDDIYFSNSFTEGMVPTGPGETLDFNFSFLVKTSAVSKDMFLEYLQGLTIYYKVYYAMTQEDIVDGRTKEIEIPYTCEAL